MFMVDLETPAEIAITDFVISEEVMEGWGYDGDKEVWMDAVGNERNKWQVMKRLKFAILNETSFYRSVNGEKIEFIPTAKELEEAEKAMRIELVS